jgi:hypothetical protein
VLYKCVVKCNGRYAASLNINSSVITLLRKQVKMATRNLRSRTAEFADTNVNVEVHCTGDSSYRQSEALSDEERGTSAISPL